MGFSSASPATPGWTARFTGATCETDPRSGGRAPAPPILRSALERFTPGRRGRSAGSDGDRRDCRRPAGSGRVASPPGVVGLDRLDVDGLVRLLAELVVDPPACVHVGDQDGPGVFRDLGSDLLRYD